MGIVYSSDLIRQMFFLSIFIGILYSVSFATQFQNSNQTSHSSRESFVYQDPTMLFYSIVPPEPSFSIFSAVGTSYITDFRTQVFKDYSLVFLKYKDKTVKEEVVTYSTLDFHFSLAYKYFLFKNLLQLQFGSSQFFDSKGFLIHSKGTQNFQTLYIPEFHFVLNFFSVGMGFPFGSNNFSGTAIRSHIYNLNFPIFSVSSTLKLYKWPSFVNSSFQFHSASFVQDFIYSGLLGIQVDLSYYITLSFSYKGFTKISQKIRDNSVIFDFHYRILRDFSGIVSFTQSIYSENRRPYNEFCFKIGYRRNFSLPRRSSFKETFEEKLSPQELQEVQKAIDILLTPKIQ